MRALSRYYDEVDEELIQLRGKKYAILHLSFPELERVIKPSSGTFLKHRSIASASFIFISAFENNNSKWAEKEY
jgi:hypothetical protein